jgi:hypothetical protein
LPKKVLRGIKPQGTTFKYDYFSEFETEVKNISGCEFRDYIYGADSWRKPEVENHVLVSL